MNSDEPGDDNGMIFVYDNPAILDFWMKNVKYDLDILFFDQNLEFVDQHTMKAYQGEDDNDLDIYKSKSPAMYAVELKSGWYNKNSNGDSLKLKF